MHHHLQAFLRVGPGGVARMSSKRRGLGRGLDALLGAGAGARVRGGVVDHPLRELPLDSSSLAACNRACTWRRKPWKS